MSEAAAPPDVTVVIAAYNAAAFIAPAVQSALAQSDVTVELIVVDDASSDGTLDAARAAARGDPRLICDALPANAGPSAARNRALALARGRFIAVLDADDAFGPGRLARLVALADAENADILADNPLLTADPRDLSDGRPLLRPNAFTGPATIDLATLLDPRTARRFGACLGYLKPIFRRRSLEAAGVRYDETLRNSEDFYFIAEWLARGARMIVTSDTGYAYTQREGSLSHRLNPTLTANILSAESRLLDEHGDAMSARTLDAARRRRRRLERTHVLETVVAALQAHDPRRAIGAVAGRVSSAPYIFGCLALVALRKLTGGRGRAST